MPKNFTDAAGSGTKERTEQYSFSRNGEHRMRLVGGILPRYVYWVQNPQTGKKVPVECLDFDREAETFTNKEENWVKKLVPDVENAAWSYAMLCLDLNQGAPVLKVVNFKRKLYEQIREAARELGDPTDPDEGWDVVFTRKRTGSSALNVEYTLNQIGSMKAKRPLTDDEKLLVENSPTIDEILPRATPEKQREYLERIMTVEGADEDSASKEAAEFDGSEAPNELPE